LHTKRGALDGAQRKKNPPLQEISDIGQEIEQAEKQDHLNDAMSVLHDINADLIEDAKLRERNT